METMKPLICKCCGGPVDRIHLKCKFCGIEYDLSPKPLYIETFRNPVEHFTAGFMASDEMLYKMGVETVSKIAVENLTRELSKSIPICMRVIIEEDYSVCGRIYKGDIRMVRPVKVGD